jgi:hypothetical protein
LGFSEEKEKRTNYTYQNYDWIIYNFLSCLVMVFAVFAGGNGAVKVSPLWLVASYGVVTIGNYVFHQWDCPLFLSYRQPELPL